MADLVSSTDRTVLAVFNLNILSDARDPCSCCSRSRDQFIAVNRQFVAPKQTVIESVNSCHTWSQRLIQKCFSLLWFHPAKKKKKTPETLTYPERIMLDLIGSEVRNVFSWGSVPVLRLGRTVRGSYSIFSVWSDVRQLHTDSAWSGTDWLQELGWGCGELFHNSVVQKEVTLMMWNQHLGHK